MININITRYGDCRCEEDRHGYFVLFEDHVVIVQKLKNDLDTLMHLSEEAFAAGFATAKAIYERNPDD